tara:strand:+ start:15596 stop:16366 length:771 start_codon:yes stop_codon:yes gene_type:complete
MLEKKISNVSSTLIVNSYEGFLINSVDHQKLSKKLINRKFDIKALVECSRNVADTIGTEIVSESEYNFQPFGDSSTFIVKSKDCLQSSATLHLKESHISFHTYLEDILQNFLIIRLEYHICSCSEYNVFNAVQNLIPKDYFTSSQISPDLITLDYLRRGSKHSGNSSNIIFNYDDPDVLNTNDSLKVISDQDSSFSTGSRHLIYKSSLNDISKKLSKYGYDPINIDIENYFSFLDNNYCSYGVERTKDKVSLKDSR